MGALLQSMSVTCITHTHTHTDHACCNRLLPCASSSFFLHFHLHKQLIYTIMWLSVCFSVCPDSYCKNCAVLCCAALFVSTSWPSNGGWGLIVAEEEKERGNDGDDIERNDGDEEAAAAAAAKGLNHPKKYQFVLQLLLLLLPLRHSQVHQHFTLSLCYRSHKGCSLSLHKGKQCLQMTLSGYTLLFNQSIFLSNSREKFTTQGRSGKNCFCLFFHFIFFSDHWLIGHQLWWPVLGDADEIKLKWERRGWLIELYLIKRKGWQR